jgi:tRNA pseudouridine38-40 synthase
VDEEVIKPILEEYDGATRSILEKALYLHVDGAEASVEDQATASQDKAADMAEAQHAESAEVSERGEQDGESDAKQLDVIKRREELREAAKRLRQAYLDAKRAYRIPEKRLNRIQDLLSLFVGTKNYHNFTVDKTFGDPSAKRVIKSFVANPTPILINGTEWLSLKVHGQSFMMHQIRKMVGMVALIVRCGCDPNRLIDALGPDDISIPKAPSLGLLLERPVFDSYNKRAKGDYGKEAINFEKYRKEMDGFKQHEIYERMYRDEEKENVFGNFFNHVDNFPEPTFLYVTSGGVDATKGKDVGEKGGLKRALIDADGAESDDEGERRDDKLGNEG